MANIDFENMHTEMVYEYRTKFPDDAKLIVDAVEKGKAVSMYYELIKHASDHSLSPKERFLPAIRFFFFVGCCLNTNNGIPMIEVVSDLIDNSPKEKTANAAGSQITLFDFLLKKEISINILADYIENRDIIEYATGDEKKSTGVLKKILDRKRAALNNSHSQYSIPADSDVTTQNPQVRKIDTLKRNLVQLPDQEKIHNQPESFNNKPQSSLESECSFEKAIREHFDFMNGYDARKHKIILESEDYLNFITWTTSYFDNDFTIPEVSTPIKKVNTAKGNVIFSYKEFFKSCFPVKEYPDSLFELIKTIFFEYRDDNIKNMGKTKEPQYYKQLKNNGN